MVNKYTAFGAAGGAIATFFGGNIGFVGSLLLGGAAALFSKDSNLKTAGKGAVVGAGATFGITLIAALLIVGYSASTAEQVASAKAILARYGVMVHNPALVV